MQFLAQSVPFQVVFTPVCSFGRGWCYFHGVFALKTPVCISWSGQCYFHLFIYNSVQFLKRSVLFPSFFIPVFSSWRCRCYFHVFFIPVLSSWSADSAFSKFSLAQCWVLGWSVLFPSFPYTSVQFLVRSVLSPRFPYTSVQFLTRSDQLILILCALQIWNVAANYQMYPLLKPGRLLITGHWYSHEWHLYMYYQCKW